jgi:hypothetical protein
LPSVQQALRQSGFRRVRIAVAGPQQGGDNQAADPVCGSFVAYGESPPSRSKRSSLPVSTVRKRTSPCIDDNPGTTSEDRLECNLHVTHYDDGRRYEISNDFAHQSCQFGARSASAAYTGALYLLRSYARGSTSLANSGVQRLSRCRLSDTNDIACTGRGGGEQRNWVPDRTRRLSPTAVNAEIIRHGSF